MVHGSYSSCTLFQEFIKIMKEDGSSTIKNEEFKFRRLHHKFKPEKNLQRLDSFTFKKKTSSSIKVEKAFQQVSECSRFPEGHLQDLTINVHLSLGLD